MKRYEVEFQKEAVRQVVENGYKRTDVALRLGINPATLRSWMLKHAPSESDSKDQDKDRQIAKLKRELRRAEEERDILKKPQRTLPRSPSKVRFCSGPCRRTSRANDVQSASC